MARNEYNEKVGDWSTSTAVNKPISWSRFYESYNDWSDEYARARLGAVTSYGKSDDEVLEVLNALFYDDKEGASKFITDVINHGMKFSVEVLIEIAAMCNNDVARESILKASVKLKDEDLEELYGFVEDDDIIIEVAKKYGLQLPEDLREEEYLDEEELDEIDDYVAPITSKRRSIFEPIFSDEETLALGLYPKDEKYKMSLISRILGKRE